MGEFHLANDRRTMTTDPNQERRRLRELYANMSDGELEKLASEGSSLTEEAYDTLEDELEHRGIADKIEDLPAKNLPQIDYRELMTIRHFRDLPAALLAQGLLKSAGIESSLADDNLVRLDWFISNLVGGVRLRVKPQDAQEALQILNQPIPAGFNVEGVGIYEQPKCPQCGSLDITFEGLNKSVAYVSAYLNVPIPIHNEGWKCASCGHEWMDEVEVESESDDEPEPELEPPQN